jgi:ankyrin repeat protein
MVMDKNIKNIMILTCIVLSFFCSIYAFTVDNTSLLTYLTSGDVEKVKELIEHGTDVNTEVAKGYRFLHIACDAGYLDIVKQFVDYGANINPRCDDSYYCSHTGETPLIIAVTKGYFNIVKYLVENRACVNKPDNNGVTPLHEACYYGHFNIVKYLVENGADINAQGYENMTPLHIASHQGYTDIAQCLMNYGADVNVKDEYDWTSLHWATKQGHLYIMKQLIDNWADIDIQNVDGNTALHIVATLNGIDMAKLLIDEGADTNIKNNDGDTALHCATRKGCYTIFGHLMQKKSCINIQNNRGDTVLHVMCNIEPDFFFMPIVIDTVDLGALKNNPHINIQNNNGDTALHIACGRKGICRMYIIKEFIHNGADTNLRNKHGQTPLNIARLNNNQKVLKFLCTHGADIHKKTMNEIIDMEINGSLIKAVAKYAYLNHAQMLHVLDVFQQDTQGNNDLQTLVNKCVEKENTYESVNENDHDYEYYIIRSLANNDNQPLINAINTFDQAHKKHHNNIVSILFNYKNTRKDKDALFSLIAFLYDYRCYKIINMVLNDCHKSIVDIYNSSDKSLFKHAYEQEDVFFFKKYINDESIGYYDLKSVYNHTLPSLKNTPKGKKDIIKMIIKKERIKRLMRSTNKSFEDISVEYSTSDNKKPRKQDRLFILNNTSVLFLSDDILNKIASYYPSEYTSTDKIINNEYKGISDLCTIS